MATYLDRLSMMTNDEDENEDKLDNAVQEKLLEILYNYDIFVIMTMDYRHTGCLDCSKVRQCILYLFRNCDGLADIKQCCRIFADCLDNLLHVQNIVMPIFTELIRKYEQV